jgi:hypothetical protein
VLSIAGMDRRRPADLEIIDGVPVSLVWPSAQRDRLVDLLERNGDLDGAAYGRAVAWTGPMAPVGGWLVEHGIARPEAISAALRVQLRRRVGRLLSMGGVTMSFAERSGGVAEPMPEPMCMAELVLRAMRERTTDWSLPWLRAQLPERPMLTKFGEEIVTQAPLWPVEATVVAMLRGSSAEGLDRLYADPRAVRFLFCLRELGGLRATGQAAGVYSLLRRKRHRLRSGGSAHELLDLPPDASGRDARRAVRRLVQILHPDRFEGEPASLKHVSTEIVAAAAEAARPIRGRGSEP